MGGLNPPPKAPSGYATVTQHAMQLINPVVSDESSCV